MKKINTFLLLMLGVFLTSLFGIQNVSAYTVRVERSSFKYERNADNFKHVSDDLENFYMDGEVAFCVEPDVKVQNGHNYTLGSINDLKATNDQKTRVMLIGYYGYNYPNHQTQKYRAATQAMIWETLMGNSAWVKFNTDYWSRGSNIDISKERSEIENLIAHHNDKPSFNGESVNGVVGQTTELVDSNNILSEFEVYEAKNADVSISGNTLSVTPTSIGDVSVKLIKKQPYTKTNLIFIDSVQQNLMTAGSVDPVVAIVGVDSVGGKVKIKKTDSETGSTAQGQATLRNAEYGIYDLDGNLITSIFTDSNGNASSDSILGEGSYYLQEISASEGYYVDHSKHYFEIGDEVEVTLNVKEKVVKNYISILKQYDRVDGNTTILHPESNITFEIYYPDGRLFDTITTDKNGYATMDIPYGIWRLHQVNSTPGFEKIYDFYITVDYNSSLEQYYNVLNNKLSAYLQIIKVDSETKKTIALANTTFKILNVDTNQYVSQYVAGKVYSEFKTDETGMVTTYLKLESGHYKLVEVKTPNGYLINENGLEFSIGNNTYFYYSEYGAFIKVEFENTPIKGQVEVVKTGETFEIKDGSYSYGEKKLEDVTFQIFADEDILTPDKNHLYYYKGDLVDTITTDENGYAISKALPLGKYFIVETATQDGYVLNTEEYHFELTEIDNQTAIVHETLSKLNTLKKATIEIVKVDQLNEEPIRDTLIEIYTMKDELIYSGKTDSNGLITLNDLVLGKYYVIEKEPSLGYLKTDEKYYFELKENEEKVSIKIKNQPIIGTLEFTKTSVTGEFLENTLIEVYTIDDKLIFSGKTDSNGKIIIEELRYGEYYIIEKQASEGYVTNSEKIYFEIKNDKEIVTIDMENQPIIGTLEFLKIDSKTEEPLSNVLIEIYNALTEELVFTGRTDELGRINHSLKYGKYYLIERETKDSYKLSDEKIYFDIKNNNETIKVTMKNEKMDMPKTFNTDLISTMVFCGTGLVGLILLVYAKKRKN